jgi:hypothetical protein
VADTIKWCVSERCRIKVFYASDRQRISDGGGIRVAGKSREQIDDELQRRIAFVLESAANRKRLADEYRGGSMNYIPFISILDAP